MACRRRSNIHRLITAAYVCTGTTCLPAVSDLAELQAAPPNAPARNARNRAQPHRGFLFGNHRSDRSRTGWRKRPRALRRCISRASTTLRDLVVHYIGYRFRRARRRLRIALHRNADAIDLRRKFFGAASNPGPRP